MQVLKEYSGQLHRQMESILQELVLQQMLLISTEPSPPNLSRVTQTAIQSDLEAKGSNSTLSEIFLPVFKTKKLKTKLRVSEVPQSTSRVYNLVDWVFKPPPVHYLVDSRLGQYFEVSPYELRMRRMESLSKLNTLSVRLTDKLVTGINPADLIVGPNHSEWRKELFEQLDQLFLAMTTKQCVFSSAWKWETAEQRIARKWKQSQKYKKQAASLEKIVLENALESTGNLYLNLQQKLNFRQQKNSFNGLLQEISQIVSGLCISQKPTKLALTQIKPNLTDFRQICSLLADSSVSINLIASKRQELTQRQVINYFRGQMVETLFKPSYLSLLEEQLDELRLKTLKEAIKKGMFANEIQIPERLLRPKKQKTRYDRNYSKESRPSQDHSSKIIEKSKQDKIAALKLYKKDPSPKQYAKKYYYPPPNVKPPKPFTLVHPSVRDSTNNYKSHQQVPGAEDARFQTNAQQRYGEFPYDLRYYGSKHKYIITRPEPPASQVHFQQQVVYNYIGVPSQSRFDFGKRSLQKLSKPVQKTFPTVTQYPVKRKVDLDRPKQKVDNNQKYKELARRILFTPSSREEAETKVANPIVESNNEFTKYPYQLDSLVMEDQNTAYIMYYFGSIVEEELPMRFLVDRIKTQVNAVRIILNSIFVKQEQEAMLTRCLRVLDKLGGQTLIIVDPRLSRKFNRERHHQALAIRELTQVPLCKAISLMLKS